MTKDEILELLRTRLTVNIEAYVRPYCGPELKVQLLLDDEVISTSTDSVSTSWLESDGEYY